MKKSVALPTLVIALAVPAVAHAQFELHDARTGPEAALFLGFGTFTNDATFCPHGSTCRAPGNLDGSFGVHLGVGYRVVPAVSAGLAFGYQFLGLDGANDYGAMNGAGSATTFGLYVAVHPLVFLASPPPLLAKVDVTVGIGFDFYANVRAWGDTFGGRGSVSLNDIAIPLSLAADYAVLPNVSVGILTMVSAWVPVGDECAQADGSGSSFCDSGGHSGEAYFFIGIGARGHFNVLR